MPFSLNLFSGPLFFESGQELAFGANRSALLLSYLASQADWVARDELLVLFWPDMREAKARQNLRTLLYKTAKESFAANLEVEDSRVRFLIKTDLAEFQDALLNADWVKATDLYKGQFLARYKGNEASAFEDWLDQTRHELQSSWHDAVVMLAEQALQRADYREASRLLEELVADDFLAEDAVQLLMKTQALSGQKAAALRTFESFRNQLNAEFDMQPIPEMIELASAIQEGQIEAKQVTPTPLREVEQVKLETSKLPQPLTPFIGRTLELLELAQLLEVKGNRLITLLGPGGMGKSRLALQFLKEQESLFADGVAFVSLAPLSLVDDIPIALAESLSLQLSGDVGVEEEVIRFLSAKEMLIVFDNFEHLVAGARFVHELLMQAQNLRLICTSRIVLNLPNEHLYDLVGLSLPKDNDVQIEAYDSVQFFLRSARRVRPSFRLEKEDTAKLIALCRKLQGMPLALELAATWLRLFNLTDLLSEIERDFDLLESSGQEVQARHKSMRVVFEQSWRLLNEQEQAVLAKLSVFQGGFDRAAAEEIASASARVLLSLINKSLVRTTATGRFSILEVIRQYAAETLHDESTATKHAKYYFDFIEKQGSLFRSSDPRKHLMAIEFNLENIKTAWRWAVQHEQFDVLKVSAAHLTFYFDLRARLQEGVSLFQEAINDLKSHDDAKSLVATLLIAQAVLYRWIGIMPEVKNRSEQGLDMLKPEENYNTYIRGLDNLSLVYETSGDSTKAKYYAQIALDYAEQSQDPLLVLQATKSLAMVEDLSGNYDLAQTLYSKALAGYREVEDAIGVMEILNNWGEMTLELGAMSRAKTMFKEAYELALNNGDEGFPYICLANLGACAYEEEDYLTAKDYYLQALQLVSEAGSKGNEVIYLAEFAIVQTALENATEAFDFIVKAVDMSEEIASFAGLMTAYFAWADYLLAFNHEDKAQLFFQIVSTHSAARTVIKQKAIKRLENGAADNKSKMASSLSLEDLSSHVSYVRLSLEQLKH